MALFDDREKAHEKTFGDDQVRHFRACSHALKELGSFAASKLGFQGDMVRGYQELLLDLLLVKPDHHPILDKLFSDFQAKKVDVSRHRIDVLFDEFYDKARQMIWDGRL